MIPQQVAVEGFLCYRTRQVINLDGSSLWIFSGQNGSGKSSIFDAITFALYGAHRGGKIHNEDLINVHSAELRIEFDFDIGGETYRITRTLPRKGTGTRLIQHREVEEETQYWTPVAETNLEAGFNRWVAAEIGLNEKMFTTAVYLQQGKSDLFLGMSPRERFGIVAEVAEIKPYQALYERAETRRKERKFERDQLQTRLQTEPPIDPAMIPAIADRLTASQEAKVEATSERDRLLVLAGEAARWVALVADHETASQAAQEARQVVAAAATVEKDWARLSELKVILPALQAERSRRVSLVDREAKIVALRRQQTLLTTQHAKYQDLDDQSRQHLQAIIEEMDRDEARRSKIRTTLKDLAIPLSRFGEARVIQRRIAKFKEALTCYPTDLASQAETHAEAIQAGIEWKIALPTLTTFARARADLIQARGRVQAAVRLVAESEVDAQRAAEACPPTRVAAAACHHAQEAADRQRIEATTLQQVARDRAGAFERLRGASACDQCGQPLTPEHRVAEARRLRDLLQTTHQNFQSAVHVAETARTEREAAEATQKRAEEAHRRASDAIAAAHRELEQAEKDIEHEKQACETALAALDESFRADIRIDPGVDWAATTFPTATDLRRGNQLASGLDHATRVGRQLQVQLEAEQAEQRQLAAAHHELDELGLEPEDTAAESLYARLTAEDDKLEACLRSHRQEREASETALTHLNQNLTRIAQEQAVIAVQIEAETNQIEANHRHSVAARLAIPAAWIPAFDGATDDELGRWQVERDELRSLDLEDQIAALPAARRDLDRATDRLVSIAAHLEAIPATARVAPVLITQQMDQAEARLTAVETDVRLLERERDDLSRRQTERTALEARKLSSDRALRVAEHLAELLGRTKLQRSLIRHAENGILDFANQVLRTISGDDLELRLASNQADDEQALDLTVIDRTHGAGRTLGVAFLSGSQRFRVAVSLAIGIGQYARGLNRPIQAVIIDEGFGSLDRTGRDEMIAQLKALRGCLDRIILVSHQEEFADAFPDGYRFKIEGDHTLIEEFHH